MGVLDWLGLGKRRLDTYARTGLLSPWAPEHSLTSVVYSEALGLDESAWPLTREAAMAIPAVARARGLVISAIAGQPLRAYREEALAPEQPTWLYRTDTNVTPHERMVCTLDDGLFYGMSLWVVERGAAGQITRAAWCPSDRWTITNGNILVDEQPVDEREVVLINWPGWDGLLNVASRTMKGARALEQSWVSKARNPIPLTVIGHDNGTQAEALDQPEINDLLKQWSNARRSEDGALGYLPPGLKIDVHGDIDPQLYVEGRNAIRVDIASFLGIPASLLDGSVAEASLTYVTTEGNRSRLYDETVPLWARPIEDRLSLDDCVPRGTRVRFDFADRLGAPSPTGPVAED